MSKWVGNFGGIPSQFNKKFRLRDGKDGVYLFTTLANQAGTFSTETHKLFCLSFDLGASVNVPAVNTLLDLAAKILRTRWFR